MTAQQQLATLLAAPDEAHALFGDAALKFLRDHGPAIAQLLHSVRELLDDPCSMTFSVTAAALRKLTQD